MPIGESPAGRVGEMTHLGEERVGVQQDAHRDVFEPGAGHVRAGEVDEKLGSAGNFPDPASGGAVR